MAKRRHPSGTGQESAGSDEDDKEYFASDLYRNLEARRSQIRELANKRRNSPTKIWGEIPDSDPSSGAACKIIRPNRKIRLP